MALWYRTGTVAVTGGSPNIVGTGTLWLSYANDGNGICLPDGKVYEVLDVVDNTHITLAENYQGTTASGQAYKLFPTHAYFVQLAGQVTQLYSDFSSYVTGPGAGKFGDGTVSGPGITFGANTNTGLYRASSNSVGFSANGVLQGGFNATSGLYAQNSFLVNMPAGAGTPTVVAAQSGDNPYVELRRWQGSASNYYYGRIQQVGGDVVLSTSSDGSTYTEGLRVLGSGNAGQVAIGGIGTGAKLTVTFSDGGTATQGVPLTLLRATSATAAAGLGARLQFAIEDAGGNYINSNAISSVWEDASTGQRKASLVFYSGAGNSLSDAGRFDSSGNFLLGMPSLSFPTAANAFAFDRGWGTVGIGHAVGTAGGVQYQAFVYNGATIGNITQSGTTGVAYNTTSDRRLKDNITPAAEAGAVIDDIEVVQHDWRADGSHVDYGVIAQDLHAVFPAAVTAGDDGDEIDRAWGVDYSKLVPLLVKELQALRARVAALEGLG